ncbi:hypothetical protein MM239_14925 [Belliella sp. DSM 111904]|uniref:Uncharacterized protein n=1 Tax=Belliella filtrata TaxID=2923435 RepID=A0ABS9V2Q3_9BACT|nr:hypothetical protein [Belliella filtrata]MCH7410699.1 hypothetical protein [Belliella filtrata]
MKTFNLFLGDSVEENSGSIQKINDFLEALIGESVMLEQKLQSIQGEKSFVEMEKSGMRKEIYLYFGERYKGFYDIGELINLKKFYSKAVDSTELNEDFKDLLSFEDAEGLDKTESDKTLEDFPNLNSMIYFNKDGAYLYALAKSKGQDPFIQEYIVAKLNNVENPILFIEGFLYNKEKLNDPLVRMIIVVEIFYPMVLKIKAREF